MPPRGSVRWALRGAGIALVLVAVMHVVKAATGDGDVVRHLVFVVLDGGLGVLVVVRPRWALVPAVILFVQQLGTHGRDLVRGMRGEAPFEVGDLAVMIFFGALIALLFRARRDQGGSTVSSGSV
jgi:hypothetical protein